MGASIAPWQVSVSLKAGSGSNPSAVLSGTTNISFVNGWANFTDLMLSHEGSGYVLEFMLSYPTDVVFSVESFPLTVTQRGLKAGVVFKSGNIFANDLTTVTLDIKDSTTNVVVSDIDWKVNISLLLHLVLKSSFCKSLLIFLFLYIMIFILICGYSIFLFLHI